jgi:hypothetical protein
MGCELDIAAKENPKGMLEVHDAERRDLSQRSAGSAGNRVEDLMDLGGGSQQPPERMDQRRVGLRTQ